MHIRPVVLINATFLVEIINSCGGAIAAIGFKYQAYIFLDSLIRVFHSYWATNYFVYQFSIN